MNSSRSAAVGSSVARTCWCGNQDLDPFSEHYRICRQCHTLVSTYTHAGDVSRVGVDDTGLYGREYWFAHMENDLGFANIYQRARTDLEDRCPYWLKTLLKYKTPPGRVLELGSAHGAFVATMRWAGFDATGLELSPGIVSIARSLFDIPVLQGPVEDQQIEAGTMDAIVLMDVLEHLSDPVATMRRCMQLLSPSGVLLIQTPRYPSDKSLDELRNEEHRFVEMLKEEEHLYLFSAESVGRFFEDLGAKHVAFEPALFGHYDMFLVVSRQPLVVQSREAQNASLNRTPIGRLVEATLGLFDRRREADIRIRAAEADIKFLTAQIAFSEADRAARLEVIERLGAELGAVPGLRAEVEALKVHLARVEADRAARLDVIERQGAELGIVPGLRAEIEALKDHIAYVEADRAARLEVIERQGAELSAVPGLRAEVEALRDHLARAEADRAARLDVINRQGAELGRIPGLQADIDYLTAELTAAREALERKDQEANRLVKDAAEKDARITSLETALRRRSGWRRFWPWS